MSDERTHDRSASQSMRPSRFGTGSSAYRVEHPGGASDGSEYECDVTRIDGSGMRVPDPSSASNASRQWPPKWMLWCAASDGSEPRTPATHSAHDGEYSPRRATRGAASSGTNVRYATGRSGLHTTASAATNEPSASRTPRTEPVGRRTMRSTSHPYSNVAPAPTAAVASPRPTAFMPP